MLVQIGLEGEGLAAALARERFQIGMSLNVSAQVGLVGEGFVADLAAERLLTCATNPRKKNIFIFNSISGRQTARYLCEFECVPAAARAWRRTFRSKDTCSPGCVCARASRRLERTRTRFPRLDQFAFAIP